MSAEERRGELEDLAFLLGQPDRDAPAVLQDMAAARPWLRGAAAEVAGLALGEWQAEHTRLFVTGYPHTPCPPFASAWLEGRMQGTILGRIEDLFADLGLEAGVDLPADYLGTLLEALAWGLEGRGADDPAVRALWDQGLAPWLGRFAAALRAEARLGLYRVLGERLQGLAERGLRP